MCQQCRFAHYCDDDCKVRKLSVKTCFHTRKLIKFSQNLAFENHHLECELLKDIFPVVPSENARLIAQLIFKTQVMISFCWQKVLNLFFAFGNWKRHHKIIQMVDNFKSWCRVCNFSTETTFEIFTHFSTFSSDSAEMMLDPTRIKEFSALCDELKVYLGSKIKWSTDEMRQIYGKVNIFPKNPWLDCSSTKVRNMFQNIIFIATNQRFLCRWLGIHSDWFRNLSKVYNFIDFRVNCWKHIPIFSISIMNHSCDPDCVVSFQGSRANVHIIKDGIDPNTPLKDVNKFRVDLAQTLYLKIYVQLTISYVDLLPPTIDRQRVFAKEWYFTCKCVVCADKEKVYLLFHYIYIYIYIYIYYIDSYKYIFINNFLFSPIFQRLNPPCAYFSNV